MQFNVAGKANARDYIAAGKAGAAAVRNNFIAARKNSPDYGGLGTININTRSAERRAATKAEADVKKTGLQALSLTKRAEIKADSTIKTAERKAGATRMAGIVGGLGMAAGGAFMGIENKRAAKLQAERDAKEDARALKELEILETSLNRESTYEPTKFDPDSVDMSDLPDTSIPIPGEQPAPSMNTPTEAEAPTTPPVAQQSAPIGPTDSGVQAMAEGNSRAKLYQSVLKMAQDVGGAKFPELVAAKAMHETGFMNPELKSVYNETNGTNLFGQKGDRGYGTTDDGFTIYPDQRTAVADHIKLWHDTNNHAENYNAFDTVGQGLDAVLPAYSPNSDPQNVQRGFTENAYRKNIEQILQTYGIN